MAIEAPPSGQQVVMDLLRYIGVLTIPATTPSPTANLLNRPQVIEDDINKAIQAVNKAIEDIFTEAPDEFKRQEKEAFLNAPKSIAGGATAKNRLFSTTQKEDWMLGCSIRITGDDNLNRVVSIDSQGLHLLYAYAGATNASLTATVFADCCLIEDNIRAVYEPVLIRPNRLLVRSASRQEFEEYTYAYGYNTYGINNYQKSLGTPTKYFVDTYFNPSVNYTQIYIRFNPMPSYQMSVMYIGERKPEILGREAIGTDGLDPGYEFTSMPADWVNSILIPMARQNFTSHPAFKNAESKANIAMDDQRARAKLKRSDNQPTGGSARGKFI